MAVKFAQVLLFGDSLTQYSFSPHGGWGATIADHFQRRADIINRGFSGYNTEWAKLILPRLLLSREQADAIVIFFGANDSALPGPNPKQHVPLSNFKSNLVEMCCYINSLGIGNSSLILITPPALCESKWAATCKERGYDTTDRSSANTHSYAQAVLDVGQDRNITTIDLFGDLNKTSINLEEYLSDGLHFGPLANQLLAKLTIPVLEAVLQDKVPEAVFPQWRDVDPENIQHSLGLS